MRLCNGAFLAARERPGEARAAILGWNMNQVLASGAGDAAGDVAEVAIAVVLRRLQRAGREPSFWEAKHILLAMHAFKHHDYHDAIGLAGAAATRSDGAAFGPGGGPLGSRDGSPDGSLDWCMRLIVLQSLFEGLKTTRRGRRLH